MKVNKYGVVIVKADGIEINDWDVCGSGKELERFALRRACWALFLAWLGVSIKGFGA